MLLQVLPPAAAVAVATHTAVAAQVLLEEHTSA